jgi:hypothetical protein
VELQGWLFTHRLRPLSFFPRLQVKSIEEEEYCLIPMGGVLPTHPQRVLGIGGTAGMVHPSTGEPNEQSAFAVAVWQHANNVCMCE